jgi:Mannosyl-glycoprotein endo-beta-N-acetylglucosaminidase
MGLIPSPTILSTDEMGRIAPPIFTSVGRDGLNAPGDVFVVQSLLNDRLPKPHAPIPVTGVADVGTVLAIENYQAAIVGLNPPTGRVDPGSATYYSLAARPLIDPAKMAKIGHYGELPPPVIDAAVASNEHWKVPAAVTLAQWVVESAWGAAMPPDSNNPFGIKAVANQPAVDSETHEVVNGETITVVVKFRVFDSIGQAFDEHGRLLATNPAYSNAMQQVQNPDAFADALTGVYATDPDYGTKLKWVIQNYKLTAYDDAPQGQPQHGLPDVKKSGISSGR